VSSNPQTVVYNVNHRATWQDGVPFNADDFIYNWQAQSGLPLYADVGGVPFDAASTAGYNQLASITASPDRFTVTTTYSTPFADWRSLFSPVAPAHIMQRVGWNKGLLAANVSAGTFISAGPFLFTSYAAGRDSDVNLRRAIALSIDRKDLIARTVGQFATGTVPDNNHFFAPGQPEYRDNSGGRTTATASAGGPYDHADVEGARRLLASSGYVLSR